MSYVLLISGSPTASSRSGALLDLATAYLEKEGFTVDRVRARDFPAEDLIEARYDSKAFDAFKAQVDKARGLIVSTPIYKASYTGGLKALLDILPQNALRGKTILPLASGGTISHLLAIDYSLKPVLSVLGASDIEQGVFAVDTQFSKSGDGYEISDPELRARLEENLGRLVLGIRSQANTPV